MKDPLHLLNLIKYRVGTFSKIKLDERCGTESGVITTKMILFRVPIKLSKINMDIYR